MIGIHNMKTVAGAAVVAAAGLLAAGCPDSNPVDGIKTQIEAKPGAQGVANAIEAERAVQSYKAKNSANPPSIEALEASEGKLKTPPRGKVYKYDPETGKIELVDG